MSVGSSYGTVKAAITALLQARSGLAGVAVSSQAPINPTDMTGSTGVADAIWIDGATGTYDDQCFRALPLSFEESYDLKVVIQSLRPSSDGTQLVADLRVDTLMYEVAAQIGGEPTLGNSPPAGHSWITGEIPQNTFNYLWALPGPFERVPGFLPNGVGHGSRSELTISVLCRHTFP